jgi:hypothetical protein
MKLRFGIIGVVLLITFSAAGFAFAGGGDLGTIDSPTDGTQEEGRFVGLTLEEAVAAAEGEGRLWRVAREDGSEFALTADLLPGRVTFEVDDGIVTGAEIEQPNTDPPPGEGSLEDQARAELIAAAVLRLVTTESSIGASEMFHDFRIGVLTGDGTPLAPLALELIAASLSEFGTVRFIDDAAAETAVLFDEEPSGVVVVAVDRVELLDDRGEIELWLWCGSLCGVWLTYEAAPGSAGWETRTRRSRSRTR